jgi:hypothetical protein
LSFVVRPRIRSSREIHFQDMYLHANTDNGKEGGEVRAGREKGEDY